MKERGLFRFGPFSIDARKRQLSKDDQPIHLTPKVFDTLLYLVENRGRILTKEEFMEAIWPDRFVEEANLVQNLSVLRRVLGEAETGVKFIATFPGKGYEFIAPVHVPADEEDTDVPQPHTVSSAAPVKPRLVWARRRKWILGATLTSALLAVTVVVWKWPREPESGEAERAGEAIRRVPVTRLPGNEYQPAISPDGAKVAFVWDRGNSSPAGIYVKGQDDSPRLISQGRGRYSSPSWSPDARFLAYLRFEDSATRLTIAPASGGEEQAVTTLFPARYGLTCRHLDWSPDGRFIAVDDKTTANEPFGIFLVSPATGEKTRLTKPETDIIGDVDPRFAPDGQSLAFVRIYYRFNHELFTVPVGGGAPRKLTADDKQIGGHDWTADGTSLIFSSNRAGEFRLWRLKRDGSAPSALPQLAAVSSDFPIHLSIARQASVLVFSAYQQDLNIWQAQLASGRGGGTAIWSRIIASTGEDTFPQFSPDSRRICFRSDRSGEEQLWVCNADGSDPVQITFGALRPGIARWSPDGGSVVFNHVTRGDMYVVSSRGGQPRRIGGAGTTGFQPAFSADGKWIYFFREPHIYRMPSAGGPVSQLSGSGGRPLQFSSDGRFVYFVKGRTDSSIWKAGVETGAETMVLDGLLPGYWGSWALAPGGIYYLGESAGSPHLLFYDFSTKRPEPVAPVPEPLPPIGTDSVSFSPDLRRLICVRIDPTNSDVFRLEGFR